LKTTDFYYQNLEKKYLERKEKINNWKIKIDSTQVK
jgi:hypothetical protein